MLVVVDIGNTNTVFGFFEDDELILKTRIKTDITRTEDEFFAFLILILIQNQLALEKIEAAAISCVVPMALSGVQRFFQKYCKISPLLVSHDKHHVSIAGAPAPHLGSDLAVNAIAATELFKNHCLIVDFGTATTFSLLEYDKSKTNYLGVAIAPGLNSIMQSMRKHSAQLPSLNFQKANTVLGTTTTKAMLAGAYFGFTGLVEKLIDTMKEEYRYPLKVVATGGLSVLMEDLTSKIDFIEPNLTLLGLKYFYLLNKRI
ncbi:MAG: type III pantothenate kinase [Candidatus Midichloria sp.]|uniref:Type III pantothenate kinase n=1 Tax=Hyalomma marginatum TaxID=34627 RepID=A0A8S4BWB5_9ACAR|nr:type III pantothenate kinase [Hyalomma marginatum]CAG7593837.1 type III pantothenate kinase [Hyalomma marginatum]